MKKIHFIFSTTESLGSKFLRWHQRSPYSHVEILDERTGEILGARSTGVKIFDKPSKVHEVKTLVVSEKQYDKFFDFMYGQVGAKYDWLAYLGFFCNNKKYNHADKWFCSELVHAALRHANIKLFVGQEPWSVMPRDFYIHPFLKESDIKLV